MSKLFSYFKVSKKDRAGAQQPKDLKTWLVHGASEFVGTIVLTLGLAGISTVANKNGHVAESYFPHEVLVGFYAGLLVVGFVLFVHLRWSCDLNPAVSLYRWINGTNKTGYVIYKIAIQFVAAILVGLAMYGMGTAHGAEYAGTHDLIANHAIRLSGVHGTFNYSPNNVGRGFIIFVAELVMMMILLFTVFSSSINDKYRDLMIMFIISLDVWMGLLTGTAAINPARGLAQQVPGLFFGAHAGYAKDMADIGYATLAMELGTLLAPFGYALVRGMTEHWINPSIHRIIAYKNFRTDNMKTDPQ